MARDIEDSPTVAWTEYALQFSKIRSGPCREERGEELTGHHYGPHQELPRWHLAATEETRSHEKKYSDMMRRGQQALRGTEGHKTG